MDVSSPESSRGREWFYLCMRRFLVLLSPLHSSHVSVTEVCPAAQPHVRRILSLFINCLPTHTPPPPICRGSYITARGFLGYGRFTTISLPSLFYPFCKTHIFSSLDIYLKHTFGVKHTKSHNKGCCLIRCVPEPSLVSRLYPSGSWLKWICWHIRTDHACSLLPLWRNALLQSTVHRRLTESSFLHTVRTRRTFKLISIKISMLFYSTSACQHPHTGLSVSAVKTISWLPSAVCLASLLPVVP